MMIRKLLSAWSKKARLAKAMRHVRVVAEGRSSSVQKDPQLVFIERALRRGDESASRKALEQYLVVAHDLTPQQRSLLAMAKNELGMPRVLYAVGYAIRVAITLTTLMRWIFDCGS